MEEENVKKKNAMPYSSAQHRGGREYSKIICSWDFPGGSVVKNPPANAGDRV